MKKFSFYATLLLSLSFYSCNTTNTDGKDVETYQEVLDTLPQTKIITKDARKIGPVKSEAQLQIEKNRIEINSNKNHLYGYWVGMFGKNKINIALYSVVNDSIFGHSICAGNYRAIKGTINTVTDGKYTITMNEPGDDKYDGEFQFSINVKEGRLNGKWSPFKTTTQAKVYELHKKEFNYDPTIGNDKGSFGSSRYLDVPDVENMLESEIELERNRIYARHGYSFDKLKLRRVFEAEDWYMPMTTDVRDELTDIEVANIDLLYNYEDYLEDYYNDYGR